MSLHEKPLGSSLRGSFFVVRLEIMAGVTGLEPAASGVTGRLISQENQSVFRLLGCPNAL